MEKINSLSLGNGSGNGDRPPFDKGDIQMTTNPLSLLSNHAADLGIVLPQDALPKFDIYLRELKIWNEKFNLTAIKDDQGIAIKHFLDSLTPLKFIKPGSAMLDIGSGAGFPGIPLKIVEPSLKITLIDSVNKKVTFMKHIISELGLTDIEAVHSRAEELAKTKKGNYDVVISRALTNLSDFIKLGEPLLKADGVLIAMKGSKADEEVKEAVKIMGKRKMQVRAIERLSLPMGAGERGLVIIEKKIQ